MASGMFFIFCFLHLIGDQYKSLASGQRRTSDTNVSEILENSGWYPSEGISSSNITILKLAYLYGPNSPIADSRNRPPTLAEILEKDRTRVDYLLQRSRVGTEDTKAEESKISIPLPSGLPLGTGDYILTVGIGTPPVYQKVILDTGSHICWVQCMPCRSCFKQRDAIWNPSKSSSYERLPCSSSRCNIIDADGLYCSNRNNCIYSIAYGDGSHTAGFVGLDVLALSSIKFPEFMFGCGVNNGGTFKGISGLFGMGRQSTSLISQISNNLFSYCLTRTDNGFLKLGGVTDTAPISYTPMLDMFDNYGIKLEGISVRKKRLLISPSYFSEVGIIDSGTVFTQLPHALYSTLRKAFITYMPYPMLDMEPGSLLDTCFNFSSPAGTNIIAPTISLHFVGKGVMRLGRTQTIALAPNDSTLGCLAFSSGGTLILGNWQQSNFEVVYDLGKQRIGFRRNAC